MKLILLLFILFISGCSSNVEEIENITENVSLSPAVNESVENETEENVTVVVPVINTCLDTDGGKTYDSKGTIVLEGKNYRTVTDYCEGGSLVEYYCKDDNTLGTEIHICSASVCLDGYCGSVSNETNSS